MSRYDLHAEWLSLIEVSGPFLALPVLKEVFPQGLEELDAQKRKRLRQAYEEWREALELDDPLFPELHRAWIHEVLAHGLELDEDGSEDVLRQKEGVPEGLRVKVPEHGVTLVPDFVVVDEQRDELPMLLIQVYPPEVDLGANLKGDGWSSSPAERMVHLCRQTGCRLGLLTNGEHWMLVDAPVGAVSTFASWYARIWGQEPVTLQAFVSLLNVRRFFVDESEQLPALLDRSLEHQDEVTEALGEQVRRAVEVLIQALDRADQDRQRELLRDIAPGELYEAGLTVMMRLVFLLCAEERGLLLLGDERYEANYALSTLRSQLRLESEEILERRWDAWARLLALFRAVYGGIEHENLRLPALGGSLFDPDRFPFLEGRAKGSNWRYDQASPLPIDNRTVSLLLDAIQQFEGRTLSYRALDVEQIGHVYEGLLERTVKRTSEVTLELDGTRSAKIPWVTLGELESARLDGVDRLATLLKERTGSSESRIRNALGTPVDDIQADRLLTVCQNDQALRDRIAPYFHLLRTDPWGYPLVYPKDSFIVTTGTERRETGTHYTPKALTEAIVEETLEPLAYAGPSGGWERSDWVLKSPAELLELKVCDLAMGSGAFLVQVCRWLSERLVEAWRGAEARGGRITADGEAVDELGDSEPLSNDEEERLITARRLVAERCLYGVDLNPLAVELAKLSIWLITLAKGRPFGFLDHNLRHGDSLLGIVDLDQLHYLEMKPGHGSGRKLFAQRIDQAVQDALDLRKELRARPIRDIRDVEVMASLDERARRCVELPEIIADALVGEVLAAGGKTIDLATLSIEAGDALEEDEESAQRLRRRAHAGLSVDLPAGKPVRRPFHWVLEFPEVFSRKNGGFDAIVGNPPFLGGKRITAVLGHNYREYLVIQVADCAKGSADYVAYFFLKAFALLKQGGTFGLLAVNTIAEGDSRQVGLERLLKAGASIYSAHPDEVWPGKAAVVTSRVHIYKGDWPGGVNLNGDQVAQISSYLCPEEEWTPKTLKSNAKIAFQGANVNGTGFTLSPLEAKEMISADQRNADVLGAFITGDDITTSPSLDPETWIVNFWDWDEKTASTYTLPYRWVESRVKSHRESLSDSKKRVKEKWWQYEASAKSLYRAVGRGAFLKGANDGKPLKRVYIIPRVAKYLIVCPFENTCYFSDSTVIFATDDDYMFSILQSCVHVEWAWKQGSRMKRDIRYTPTSIFGTLPLPELGENVRKIRAFGELYLDVRLRELEGSKLGLTKLYNRFNDPDVNSDNLVKLRELQTKIDYSVVKAYGWSDLKLAHDFYDVPYLPENDRVRFTISDTARLEILRRLSLLNKQRYEEEQRGGPRSSSSVVDLKGRRGKPIEYDNGPVRDRSLDKVAEPKAPQMGLFESVATEDSQRPRTGNQWGSNAIDQIYTWLESNEGRWFTREAILAGCGADEMDWDEAIDALISDGNVETKKNGKTIRYRVVI